MWCGVVWCGAVYGLWKKYAIYFIDEIYFIIAVLWSSWILSDFVCFLFCFKKEQRVLMSFEIGWTIIILILWFCRFKWEQKTENMSGNVYFRVVGLFWKTDREKALIGKWIIFFFGLGVFGMSKKRKTILWRQKILYELSLFSALRLWRLL